MDDEQDIEDQTRPHKTHKSFALSASSAVMK